MGVSKASNCLRLTCCLFILVCLLASAVRSESKHQDVSYHLGLEASYRRRSVRCHGVDNVHQIHRCCLLFLHKTRRSACRPFLPRRLALMQVIMVICFLTSTVAMPCRDAQHSQAIQRTLPGYALEYYQEG